MIFAMRGPNGHGFPMSGWRLFKHILLGNAATTQKHGTSSTDPSGVTITDCLRVRARCHRLRPHSTKEKYNERQNLP